MGDLTRIQRSIMYDRSGKAGSLENAKNEKRM